MEPISRSQAVLLGLNRYYTGKPCKHGHTAHRYVHSGTCVECAYGHVRNQRRAIAEAQKQAKEK